VIPSLSWGLRLSTRGSISLLLHISKPLTIVINNIIYLGVTLIKQVKDLYDKTFKSLKKKLKKISEDGKISHAHGEAGLT
jgi:transcriptional antiterminator